MNRRHAPSATTHTLPGLAGTLIVVLAGAAARRGIGPWEEVTLRTINTLPDALYTPVWPVMQFGSLTAVGVVASLASRHGESGRAARVAVAGGAAWLVCKPLKRLAHRRRPDPEADRVKIRGSAQTGLGYPSGHAAVATAMGVVLAKGASTRQVCGFAGLAGAVGMSRIYVGAHYPLDVLGGWAAGMVTGMWGLATFDRSIARRVS